MEPGPHTSEMEAQTLLQIIPDHPMSLSPASDEPKTFRMNFEATMPSSNKPIKHESTSVLLLSYKYPEMTDMDVGDELQNLGTVFKEDYGFNVEQATFTSGKNVQLQMTSYLSNFALAHSSKSHALLIIYYAGHGWHSRDNGRNKCGGFDLGPRRHDYDRGFAKDQMVMWEETERILLPVQGDVLVIFDCCDTGALKSLRSYGRAFEYFGACGEGKYTHGPGENSFTSALVWALRELQHTASFTTTELCAKLSSHKKFPKSQEPFLSHRHGYMEEPIWISSMRKPKRLGVNSQKRSSEPEFRDDECDYVDLRVTFSRHLTDDDGIKVAEMVKPLVAGRRLPLNARHVRLVKKGVCKPKLALERWNRAQKHVIATQRFWTTSYSNSRPNNKRKREPCESENQDTSPGKQSGSSIALDVDHITEFPITPTSEGRETGNERPTSLHINTSINQEQIPASFPQTIGPVSMINIEDLLRDLERLKQNTLQRPEMLAKLYSQIRGMLEIVEDTMVDAVTVRES